MRRGGRGSGESGEVKGLVQEGKGFWYTGHKDSLVNNLVDLSDECYMA